MLYAVFVDLSMAFPSAPRALICIKSLFKRIPVVLVRLVVAIYRDTGAYIVWAGHFTRLFKRIEVVGKAVCLALRCS